MIIGIIISHQSPTISHQETLGLLGRATDAADVKWEFSLWLDIFCGGGRGGCLYVCPQPLLQFRTTCLIPSVCLILPVLISVSFTTYLFFLSVIVFICLSLPMFLFSSCLHPLSLSENYNSYEQIYPREWPWITPQFYSYSPSLFYPFSIRREPPEMSAKRPRTLSLALTPVSAGEDSGCWRCQTTKNVTPERQSPLPCTILCTYRHHGASVWKAKQSIFTGKEILLYCFFGLISRKRIDVNVK